MDKIQLIKWFLFAITIFSIPLIFCQAADANLNAPSVVDCRKSYSNILRALRENWESPIMYLKKRGYIPKDSEPAFISKFNIKRRNKENDEKADDLTNVYEFNKNLHVREDMIESLANANKAVPQSILYTQATNAPSAPSAHTVASVTIASARKPIPQSILYTPQQPRKSFLKNMKDKFLGLFSGKKKSFYNGAYANDFDADLQKVSNKKGYSKEFDKTDDFLDKDYLKDFDKDLLNKKFNKDRDYDKDILNMNIKNLRSVLKFNDRTH